MWKAVCIHECPELGLIWAGISAPVFPTGILGCRTIIDDAKPLITYDVVVCGLAGVLLTYCCTIFNSPLSLVSLEVYTPTRTERSQPSPQTAPEGVSLIREARLFPYERNLAARVVWGGEGRRLVIRF